MTASTPIRTPISTPTLSNLSPGSPFAAPAGSFLLHLARELAYEDCTIGKLFIDGVWVWWTQEAPLGPVAARPHWAPATTAIPAGVYQIRLARSGRDAHRAVELLQVPGYPGARFCASVTPDGGIVAGGGFDPTTQRLHHTSQAQADVRRTVAYQITQLGKPVWIEVIDPPERRA